MRSSRLCFFLAVLLLPSLAAAFSLSTDVARFGPADQVALTRVEGDDSHVHVAVYGDAPVVRFLLNRSGAVLCVRALSALTAPPVAGVASVPPSVRCEAATSAATC